jgi:hypothetical protein
MCDSIRIAVILAIFSLGSVGLGIGVAGAWYSSEVTAALGAPLPSVHREVGGGLGAIDLLLCGRD